MTTGEPELAVQGLVCLLAYSQQGDRAEPRCHGQVGGAVVGPTRVHASVMVRGTGGAEDVDALDCSYRGRRWAMSGRYRGSHLRFEG